MTKLPKQLSYIPSFNITTLPHNFTGNQYRDSITYISPVSQSLKKLTIMTPIRPRVPTPVRTHLRMSHIPRILAVEKHILQVRSLQILRLENSFEVRLGEACIASISTASANMDA